MKFPTFSKYCSNVCKFVNKVKKNNRRIELDKVLSDWFNGSVSFKSLATHSNLRCEPKPNLPLETLCVWNILVHSRVSSERVYGAPYVLRKQIACIVKKAFQKFWSECHGFWRFFLGVLYIYIWKKSKNPKIFRCKQASKRHLWLIIFEIFQFFFKWPKKALILL